VLTTAGATRLLAGIQGISLAVVSDGGANAIAPQAIICGGRFTPNCVPGMEFLRISDGGDVALMQRTPGYVVKALVRDGVGNYYLTQYGSHAIYKWTPGVGISVHAGGGAGASDGLVGEARFSEPSGLAFDALGNLFVADSGNHAIRRISTTGEVTTFARFAPLAMTEPATMHLAIDAGGNVYMADGLAHVVRKFARDGSASILVGVEGRPGFATGALPALLQRPTAVAVLGNDLYIGTDNAVLVVKGVQP
jgi:hypothetical protein